MKKFLQIACIVFAAGGTALTAHATSPDVVLANVQDTRMADIAAVQSAMESASPAQKAAMVADFQRRDQERAAQVGAASRQIDLAQRAALKTQERSNPQPNAATR